MDKNKRKIIYINFAPYENTGNILDYFKKKFHLVVLFLFSFHKLRGKKDINKLLVFKDGKIIDKKPLFDFAASEHQVFIFLPIRSLLILLQIIFYTFYLYFKYGMFYYYFSVNAFTSYVGNILRKMSLVKNTIFWVWDYYPPKHRNKIVRIMRGIYWQFDKVATQSDKVVFLNQRLYRLRKRMGVINPRLNFDIIPIGTNPNIINKISKHKTIKIGFMGVIKKSQGLGLVTKNLNKIKYKIPNIEFHIIGDGPDLDYFQNMAKGHKEVKFYKSLEDTKMDKILSACDICIAPYIPQKDNVSYYGDPSKIKRYLSLGKPVISTNVFEFSKELSKSGSGIIISYNVDKLILAIKKINKTQKTYSNNANLLSKKYEYSKLYNKIFS